MNESRGYYSVSSRDPEANGYAGLARCLINGGGCYPVYGSSDVAEISHVVDEGLFTIAYPAGFQWNVNNLMKTVPNPI